MNKVTLTALSMLALTGSANAQLADFESFTANQSVNGQSGWTVEDSFGNSGELFDEEIVDLSGNQVWRISNSFTATSYSNQPFSHSAPQIAGQTGAGLYNDYGTNHTSPNSPPLSSGTAGSKFFYASWDFKSATGAAQPGMNMAVSASGKQSTLRMSYLNMQDTGSGFNVGFFDTEGTAFNGSTLATGLSYTDWHNVEMMIEFVDGIGPGAAGSEMGNDIMKVWVDGSLVHTGTTWESFFYNVADGGVPTTSPRAVDSLLFRQSGTANMANAGAGFYFDNVVVSNVPTPASAAILGLGGMAAFRRRR